MCSGPFRGASGTQQIADLHRRKRPHILEAWRSGSFSSAPLRRPRSELPVRKALMLQSCTFGEGWGLEHSCFKVAHWLHIWGWGAGGAGCSKLHIGYTFGGLGGLGGLGAGCSGPHGPVVLPRVPQAARPSKEVCGDCRQRHQRTTSPRFQ